MQRARGRARVWLSRLLDPFLRSSREEVLDEEIRTHLTLLTAEFEARGFAPEEARLAARRAFGGADRIKLLYREQRGLPWVDALGNDVRLAFRALGRDRAFAVTAAVVLGLGIGITHMFLTIVYAHTWRGLPVPEPERLLHVSVLDERGSDRPLTRAEFDGLTRLTTAFASLVAFTSAPITLGDEGRAADRVEASYVGPDAFASVGARPVIGRDFSLADHADGASPTVLLGRSVWRGRYGARADILGRQVLVHGTAATVVGIMPDASGFPTTAAVWLPLAQMPGASGAPQTVRNLRVIGRLEDGRTEGDARTEVEQAVTAASASAAPGARVRARVMRIDERLFLPIEGPWLAFLVAGLIVVLIACANIGNLMLARGFHRAREVAVRASLGASRSRLVRQLLTEALVIAGVGGGTGLAVSLAGTGFFSRLIPQGTLPYWLDYSLDGRLLAVLVVVCTASAVLFGFVPAMLLSRTDINAVLREGGRANTAARTGRPWMIGFLSVEIALALLLLATIAIGSLSLRSTLPSDRTIMTTDVVTAVVTLPPAPYATANARARFMLDLIDRARRLPQVTAASAAAALPIGGSGERGVRVEGDSGDREPPAVATVAVGPGYFATLGLGPLEGREFTIDDGRPGARPILVNERFVEQFLAARDPLGLRLELLPDAAATASTPHTIIGVVPLLRQRDRPGEGEPLVYLPLLSDAPATSTLVVRAPGASDVLPAMLREAAREIDPNVPLYRMQSLAQAVRDATWNSRLSAQLATTLTGLCMFLATVGLYAVTAHGVSLRRQEMGIRMALGATPGRIAGLVVASVRVPLALGLLLGIGGALAWSRAFPSGRADLTVTNPLVLAVVAAVLVLVTTAACAVPARRAATLAPGDVLRES